MKGWGIFFKILLSVWVFLHCSVVQARRLVYMEEFYKLYCWPLYTTKVDARRNLLWLEVALKAPFAPAIEAMVICKTPEEYEKYQSLFKMHLNHLMARSCLVLAAQFDVQETRWYQKPYKEAVIRSLQLADYYYGCVDIYWEKVQLFSQESAKISRIRLDMESWEDVAFKVRKGVLNLQKLSTNKREKIKKKIQFYQNL